LKCPYREIKKSKEVTKKKIGEFLILKMATMSIEIFL